MDKTLKKKWLEALRSGEYKKGRRFLRKDGAYCCLGVLSDLMDPEGWCPGIFRVGAKFTWEGLFQRVPCMRPGSQETTLIGWQLSMIEQTPSTK